MSILSEIYDGWKNLTFPNSSIENEAKRRIIICIDCDRFSNRKICNLCGCYMPAKVRSIKSKCRLNKW